MLQGEHSAILSIKYCRMLQGEHSAILSIFIKLPFVIKTCVLSVFGWPLKTGFTVESSMKTLTPYVGASTRKQGDLIEIN